MHQKHGGIQHAFKMDQVMHNNANGTASFVSPAVLDVLVVGAGQAGVAAAHHLLSRSSPEPCEYAIHIVEANNHVAGRTRNYDVATQEYDTISENAIELGGTWLSPEHTAVLSLCRDLSCQFSQYQ